jgi:hypothetical protein
MIMSHDKILFECIKKCILDFQFVFDVLDLGDTRQVGEYRSWLLTVDHFKGSHASGSVVKCVVPPFKKW